MDRAAGGAKPGMGNNIVGALIAGLGGPRMMPKSAAGGKIDTLASAEGGTGEARASD